SDPGPSRRRCRDRQRARRAVRDDASCHLEAHQGAGTSRVGLTGSTSPVPTVRPRCRTTRAGLDLGRAVPARLGGPLRPDGRLPQTTRTATKDRANTMTDNSGSQNAVVIERSFDAPVDLIWQMWTDPEHFSAWYGPDGATIPVAKMDVRVGGTRLLSMEVQTPGGPMQMWFNGEFRQEATTQRLVYMKFIPYDT